MLRTLRHIRHWNVLFKSNALLKFFVIRLFHRYLAHLYNSPLFHCLLDPFGLLESSFIWLFPKYLAHLLLCNKTNKNLCIPRIFPYLIVLLESRALLKLSSLLDISIASLEFYSILCDFLSCNPWVISSAILSSHPISLELDLKFTHLFAHSL